MGEGGCLVGKQEDRWDRRWVGNRIPTAIGAGRGGGGEGEPLTHQAIRLEGAALSQHGQQRLLAEKQLTDNAIAAPEAAATPGPSELMAA